MAQRNINNININIKNVVNKISSKLKKLLLSQPAPNNLINVEGL